MDFTGGSGGGDSSARQSTAAQHTLVLCRDQGPLKSTADLLENGLEDMGRGKGKL